MDPLTPFKFYSNFIFHCEHFEYFWKNTEDIKIWTKYILSSTNDNCEKEGSSELELEQTVSNLFEHVKTYTILLTVTRQDSIYAIYNGTPIALAAPFWHRLPPRIVIPSKLFEIKKVKLWHKRKRAYLCTLFMLQVIL